VKKETGEAPFLHTKGGRSSRRGYARRGDADRNALTSGTWEEEKEAPSQKEKKRYALEPRRFLAVENPEGISCDGRRIVFRKKIFLDHLGGRKSPPHNRVKGKGGGTERKGFGFGLHVSVFRAKMMGVSGRGEPRAFFER